MSLIKVKNLQYFFTFSFQISTAMADLSLPTETGRIVKMEVDYSVTCDEKIPEWKKMAQEGKIHDALDALLALEKQTRTVC